MGKSLKTRIAESKARTRRLENKLPLKLGKNIMKNHKLVVTNAKGEPVTYKSTAKDTKGQILTRHRTIDSTDEFNKYFKVVSKDSPTLSPDIVSAIKRLAVNYHIKKTVDLVRLIQLTAGFADDPEMHKIYHMMIYDGPKLVKAIKKLDNNSAENSNNSDDDNDDYDDSSNRSDNDSDNTPDESDSNPTQNDPSRVE